MSTIVFVHGTGVREDAYQISFDVIEAELAKRSDAKLIPCYWGELGSRLNAGGLSIPTYDTARAAADGFDPVAATDADYQVALWAMLAQDPLFELRALAGRETSSGEVAPGQLPPGARLAELGKQFVIPADLQLLLDRGGIGAEFEETRSIICATDLYRTALAGAPASLSDHRSAIARALIAGSVDRVVRGGSQPLVSWDADLRDEIEERLVDLLGGKEYGLGGWLKTQLKGVVSGIATGYLERKRGAITDATTPAAGDIVLYQARGEPIRELIRARLSEVEPPKILLGHSLGGIACLDLLIDDPCGVDLFVTVGSQGPFLYEIDALQSLPYGSPLPKSFPRWLNFFDLRDMLSYKASELFDERVTDIAVDNREPFPASHSAYWTNKALWEALIKHMP